VAYLPALAAVPLISFDAINKKQPEPEEKHETSLSDLHILDGNSQDPAHSSVAPPSVVDNDKAAVPSSSHSGASHTGSAGSHEIKQDSSPPSTQGSGQQVQKSVETQEAADNMQRSNTQQVAASLDWDIPSLAPVASMHPEAASLTEDWETAPAQNIYAPPAISVPWGEEENSGWGTSNNNQTDAWSSNNQGDGWNTNNQASGWKDTANPNGSTRGWSPARSHSMNGNGRHNGQRNESVPKRRFERGSRRTPVTFDGSWDEMVESNNTSNRQNHGLTAFKYAESDRGDRLDRPIKSDIGVNAAGQRIDLKLPQPPATAYARFDNRWRTRRLCNEHQLRNACNNAKCAMDHEPVDDGVLLALRHAARKLPCSVGPACRRHDCFYGHQCPFEDEHHICKNHNCGFNARGMHEVKDLRVVDTIRV